MLVHGRWFSPGTPASSTTKTGRHDIAEILLKVTLNTKNQIKSSSIYKCTDSVYPLWYLQTLLITTRCVFDLFFRIQKKYPANISLHLHHKNWSPWYSWSSVKTPKIKSIKLCKKNSQINDSPKCLCYRWFKISSNFKHIFLH